MRIEPQTTTTEPLHRQVDPEFIDGAKTYLCKKNLKTFIKYAWSVIEPGVEYKENWHIGAICEYLQAVTDGEITKLLITIPPRHMKSICVSIMWPAWVWTNKPYSRFICTSYAQDLATEHSVKCRRIIESDWYRARFSDFKLTTDQNVKQNFENDRTGARYAAGVGGSITGKGGDYIIADDPHNIKDIHSKIKREGVLKWWREVISTRLNDPDVSGRVILMQRGHAQDLAGELINSGTYTHLNLPGIAESRQVIKLPISGKSEIREEGDLLWPGRFSKKKLDELKIDLGTYGFASQIQQRPTPEGGGIWKREWWQYFREAPLEREMVLQSWDTAFKAKQENDYSVCSTWFKTATGFYLVDLWRGRVEFPELKTQFNALANKWKPEKIIIEDKASGQSLIQELKKNTTFPVFPVKVDRDKVARANAVSPQIEAGNVLLPENAPWVADFLEECESFPHVDHDDQVDSVSQGLEELSLKPQQRAYFV